MAFGDDLMRFADKLDSRVVAIHESSADLVFESVVHGSAITGAPGQPVAAGADEHAGKLRDSFTKTRTSPTEIEIVSEGVDYAKDVEDNLRGVQFSNHGPHSIKLTAAGFDRIVENVARRVVGADA